MSHLPAITFRDSVTGRRAVFRSGPDVWEVAIVAIDHVAHREGLLEHFGQSLGPEDLEQALWHIERFSEETAAIITGNEERARDWDDIDMNF